MGHTSQRCDQS